MTSHPTNLLVEGEPADLLAKALLQFDFQEQPDGMCSITAQLQPEINDPFVRALMRIEARLLAEDADQYGRPDTQHRTHGQRAADAFILLVTAVVDRSGASPR